VDYFAEELGEAGSVVRLLEGVAAIGFGTSG